MKEDLVYYWSNKKGRAQHAAEHTLEMAENYSKEISDCVEATILYDQDSVFANPELVKSMPVVIDSLGSTEGIFKYAEGKTAVLNFASYKEPGGGFLAGSRAQEECLCHDSFLYNVLKEGKSYYNWNNDHKNLALYLNRALYSPDVIFFNNDQEMKCDVITCAAPNYRTASRYGLVTREQNSEALESRIKFVLDIAADQHVDTLILGAFGCGVFEQDPTEVAILFTRYLKSSHKCFKKIVFAIPADVNQQNYMAFYKTLCT